MGCCSSFMKYLLFGLNLLFWLAGVAILGVGIWLKVDPNVSNIFTVAGVSLNAGAITFIVLGCVIFLIGFCGCCGAIKESKCLLGIYFAFVLIILVVQLIVGIWGFVARSSVEELIRAGLEPTVPIDTSNPDEVAAIKNLQSIFQCCGMLNCTDWPQGNTTGCTCSASSATDDTCGSYSYCTNGDNPQQNIYKNDCFDAIVKFIDDNIVIIAGVAIGIAVAEIFLLIATIVVCNSAGKSGYETA